MTKYSFEFKKMVVLEYLDGECGYQALANKHEIPRAAQIERWVAAYRDFGDDGIVNVKHHRKYSYEMKLALVKEYLSGDISYQELASANGIKDLGLIATWVSAYRIGGADALKPKKLGRPKKVKKKPKASERKQVDASESRARLKELEDENLTLRIEIAYLKELRRLRLEEEEETRRRLESLAVSAKNLN